MSTNANCDAANDPKRPGRLGNPDLTLLDDERLDARVRQAMSTPPPPGVEPIQPPSIEMSASFEECLKFIAGMEKMLQSQDPAVLAAMPEFSDVASASQTISGEDANNIELTIDRPKASTEPLPCIVHFHGGGMAFTSAHAPSAVRWRKTLAQQGLVVVGVEFRNAGGALGNHPFPAGLNDCASATRWVHNNRKELNVSSIVLVGESGGGNLVCAAAIKANKEGWVDAIDGVFAMAPMISGFYSSPPADLASWRENEGYQGTYAMTRAMTKLYDPKAKYEHDPTAWPFTANGDALKGLPPHIITNYELDLIRDDGIVYTQKLQAAGVSAISRTINGAVHVPEIAMPDLIPDLTRDTVLSLAGFARSF